MGISGLLPTLDEITKKKSLKDYRGMKAAIDGYCWLHKAAVICADELAKG